jgi:methylated-DNA-[protein]-cysteine S-methyltransferase
MHPHTVHSMTTPSTTADQHFRRTVSSPVGDLTLVATNEGLRAVLWPDDLPSRVKLPESTERPDHPIIVATAVQLSEYFDGTRTDFDIALDLRGTAFQTAAWHALAEIPHGSSATYAEQAARLGQPSAVRAVGAANGRNPVSIVLPCHRVIGADGSLTGFAGGLDTKRRLLELEGALDSPTLPFI